MSLVSWKAEFYPVDADEVSPEGALDHSIRKWEGLRPENLVKHGVALVGTTLLSRDEDDRFFVDAYSCALCEVFYKDDADEDAGEHECGACPLLTMRGCRCDQCLPTEARSPYGSFTSSVNGGDPEPMLVQLRLAREVKP